MFVTYSSAFQVMVAALKFFLGSDHDNEKKSDDSDSDVISRHMLYKFLVLVLRNHAVC
jgi:hypothetical protein